MGSFKSYMVIFHTIFYVWYERSMGIKAESLGIQLNHWGSKPELLGIKAEFWVNYVIGFRVSYESSKTSKTTLILRFSNIMVC